MTVRRVCLINPPCPWLLNDRGHHPMGLLSLAAYLESISVPVEVLDLASVPPDRFEFPPADIYGVSSVTAQIPIALEIARQIGATHPGSMRVIGGIHATVLAEETLTGTEFDVAVIGEGELPLADLAMGLPLGEIPGIAYKDPAGAICRNPMRPLIDDLDGLPVPAFHRIDLGSYRPAGIAGAITMITARGCPYRCLFCSAVPSRMRRYRARSIPSVLGEIDTVVRRFGTRVFSIQDELFSMDRARFLSFCDAVEERRIRWRFMTRSDAIDRTLVRRARSSGCFEMCIGIESGSQRILDILEKGTTVGDNARALDTAREVGMPTMAYLISAAPGEDDATVDETIRFITAHPADAYAVMMFTPFPGTRVWREPERYGFDLPRDYSAYQYLNREGTGLSLHRNKEEAYRFHRRLFDVVRSRSSYTRKERAIEDGYGRHEHEDETIPLRQS